MENEIFACEEKFLVKYLSDIFGASPEQALAINSLNDSEPADILSFGGSGTATIEIQGVLSKTGPSRIARYFGYQGTGYDDIIESMDAISKMDEIHTLYLNMNTPGGYITGLDEVRTAMLALQKAGKKITAVNQGLIASAGYWIASGADEITATSMVAETGSIGVVITTYVDTNDGSYGYKTIKIVSRNAENKDPDLLTKDGIQVLQDRADAIERVFLKQVSDGRNISVETIIDKFGKGGVYIAYDPDDDKPDALSIGMIDSIESGGVRIAKKEKEMAIKSKEIKTENPESMTLVQAMEQIEALKAKIETQSAAPPAPAPQVVAPPAPIPAPQVVAPPVPQISAGDIAEVMPYIKSDAYPQSIKSVALRVIEGTASVDHFRGALLTYDAMKTSGEIDSAVTDTKEIGGTQSRQNPLGNPDLITDADELAAVQEIRGVR
jgi:ClpP class serine protease